MFKQIPDEYSGAPGYVEEMLWLIHKYNEASITPGLGDDLECFKRLLDHVSCRIRSKDLPKTDFLTYYQEAQNGQSTDFVSWVDYKVQFIEGKHTMIIKKYAENRTYDKNMLIAQSEAKRELRKLYREVMLVLELLGLFKWVYKEDIKTLTGDLG